MLTFYIEELKKIDGVLYLHWDLELGKEEYRFHVRDDVASKTEISARDIARAVKKRLTEKLPLRLAKERIRLIYLCVFLNQSGNP